MIKSFPSFRPLWVAALLAGGVLVATRPAGAQEAAAAEALFKEGRDLMGRGDYVAACSKFAESKRLDASSGTSLNLALCRRKQGKTASAWAEYLDAARIARQQNRLDRVEEARKNAAELEPELSYLTINAAELAAGLVIMRDEVRLELGSLGSRLPVDPGEHSVIASAPGYASVTLSVKVGVAKDSQTVNLPGLQRAEPEHATGPSPVQESARTVEQREGPAPVAVREAGADAAGKRNTVAYVVGGFGLVALGVGATFGALAANAYADAETSCPSHDHCGLDAMQQRESAGTRATISTVGVGVGAAAIGVSVVLLLTGHRSPKVQGKAAPAAHTMHVGGFAVLPAIGPSAGKLELVRAF